MVIMYRYEHGVQTRVSMFPRTKDSMTTTTGYLSPLLRAASRLAVAFLERQKDENLQDATDHMSKMMFHLAQGVGPLEASGEDPAIFWKAYYKLWWMLLQPSAEYDTYWRAATVARDFACKVEDLSDFRASAQLDRLGW